MKRLILALLALALLVPTCLSESSGVLEYVESLGYNIADQGSEGVTDRRVMLLENDQMQDLLFTVDGNLYSIMNLPQYMAKYDPSDLYRLMYRLSDMFEWDILFYEPDYSDDSQHFAISYGLTRDVEQSDANYTDQAEFTAALATYLHLDTQRSTDDLDLFGLTYDQLVSLKNQLNLAIWNSREWQEVTVPQGVWVVGEDIPAGKWTVKCADINRDEYDMQQTYILWSNALESDGDISFAGRHGVERIYNPDHRAYDPGNITECIFEFKDGDYVIVDNKHAPAVFTPYSGKPSLGFK